MSMFCVLSIVISAQLLFNETITLSTSLQLKKARHILEQAALAASMNDTTDGLETDSNEGLNDGKIADSPSNNQNINHKKTNTEEAKKIGIVWLHAGLSDPKEYKEQLERSMLNIGDTMVEWRFPEARYLDSERRMQRIQRNGMTFEEGPFMKHLWFYDPNLWRISETDAGSQFPREFVIDQRTIDRVMRPATVTGSVAQSNILQQLTKGIMLVHSTIESLRSEGIPYNKIYVGGVDQGGTVATLSALTFFRGSGTTQNRLGGVLNFLGPSLFVSENVRSSGITNIVFLRDLSVAVNGYDNGILHFTQNLAQPANTCLDIPHFMWYKVQDEKVDRALVENGIGYLRGTNFTPRVGTASMGKALFLPNVQPIPEGVDYIGQGFDRTRDGHCPVGNAASYLMFFTERIQTAVSDILNMEALIGESNW